MAHEMKIEATQTNEIVVDITTAVLSETIVYCKDISLSDMVELLRRKFLHELMNDEAVFIENGVWYKIGKNSAGQEETYKGHKALPPEKEVYEAIMALDAVMIVEKLKGNKWYTK